MGWYNVDWRCREKVTVDDDQVSGASHSNFPALVSVTSDYLKQIAQADGDDILFTSDDGETKLDHEIERYTSATGELIAHVRVPTLSGATDTVLYMYFGNPDASSQQNPTGVWDANFVGVYHLDETSGDALDSTTNGNDGTYAGSLPTQTTGKIGYGQDFDGVGDYIDIAAVLGEWDHLEGTWESWVNMDDWNAAAYESVNCFRYDGTNRIFIEKYTDKTLRFYYVAGGTTELVSIDVSAYSGWHYIAMTWSDSADEVKAYIDDAQVGTTQTGLGTWANPPDKAKIGCHDTVGGPDEEIDGKMDECTLSDVARSGDWLATRYANQNSPGTFLTLSEFVALRRSHTIGV